MIEINTSDKNEQRKFGLVMGAAIAIIGGIRFCLQGFEEVPVRFFVIAALFTALGLLAPKLLQPVFWVWMKLAMVLNWVMTRIFLAFAFYCVITPTRFFVMIFGDDPLKRAWLPKTASYWEEPEAQPNDLDSYKNQF